jgi:hypothetical protein
MLHGLFVLVSRLAQNQGRGVGLQSATTILEEAMRELNCVVDCMWMVFDILSVGVGRMVSQKSAMLCEPLDECVESEISQIRESETVLAINMTPVAANFWTSVEVSQKRRPQIPPFRAEKRPSLSMHG